MLITAGVAIFFIGYCIYLIRKANKVECEKESLRNRYQRKLWDYNKLKDFLVNFKEGDGDKIHKLLMKEQRKTIKNLNR